jgi:hypothetical protein
MFSLCLLYAFLKLLTVFDLFITPGTMFQVFDKKFPERLRKLREEDVGISSAGCTWCGTLRPTRCWT